MTAGLIDCIVTPAGGSTPPNPVRLCADNGCFANGYPGDDAWFEWLQTLPVDQIVFAVAPDVVGDAAATESRSAPWLPRIRALGIPAAFVAQDGLENRNVSWDDFDVLFIGGTTEWKLGAHAQVLVAQARRHGKSVHMGRVNSARRFRYAEAIGCDSADGTYLVFGPDKNLPKLLGWVTHIPLFERIGEL